MKKQEKARIITTRVTVAAISLAIGVLITAQWRSLPDRITNPITPYFSLKETRDSLYSEQNQLKFTIKELQKSIEKAQSEVEKASLSESELNYYRQEKAMAGLTRLNGQGLIVTYDDSRTGDLTADSIVHAADLRDTVNLLWGSGAEAITINGQRVVANTAIDCIVNTILVNNVRISNPFRIEAIGDQNLMFVRLSDPGILSDIHQRNIERGLIFTVEKNNDITVPVYDGSFETKAGAL